MFAKSAPLDPTLPKTGTKPSVPPILSGFPLTDYSSFDEINDVVRDMPIPNTTETSLGASD